MVNELLINDDKKGVTKELLNDNENIHDDDEMILSFGVQQLTEALTKISAYADGLISSLEDTQAKELLVLEDVRSLEEAEPKELLKDFRSDLLNISQKLKAVISKDCLPLSHKISGLIGIKKLTPESEEKDVKFFHDAYSGPEFPPFNSRDVFAVQTQSINRDPLAKIGQMVDGPDTRTTLSSLILPFINAKLNECQVLIVEPTHELALQTHKIVQTWCQTDDSSAKITSIVCIGGTNTIDDKRGLKRGPHIVVGTPGRIVSNCVRNSLDVNTLRVCILNHSDKLFQRGFERRVHVILQFLPPNVKFISSTKMSADMIALQRKLFRRDPVLVFIKDQLTLDGIKQFYVNATIKRKFEVLCDLLKRSQEVQCIVFCNTKEVAKRVMTDLRLNAYSVAPIYNTNMNQEERDKMVKDFLSGDRRILITTDSRSCGLDLQDVPLIFNYGLPFKQEEYMNRVGLSIRGDRKRVAITLTTRGKESTLKEMEKTFKTQILRMPEDVDVLFSTEDVVKNESNLIINENENQSEKHLNEVDENESEKENENHSRIVDEALLVEKVEQSSIVK